MSVIYDYELDLDLVHEHLTELNKSDKAIESAFFNRMKDAINSDKESFRMYFEADDGNKYYIVRDIKADKYLAIALSIYSDFPLHDVIMCDFYNTFNEAITVLTDIMRIDAEGY
jgi:regulatory protein YycH of two-component signal transduction system YycFG